MFRQHLKKYYKKFSTNKYIIKFSTKVGAKHLWDFEKDSVVKAIALGVACAWIPLPFHTIIAVFIAILIDCNIPLVAIAIWVANPITMPFMYYSAYILGDFLLNIHKLSFKFHLSIKDVLEVLHEVWEPFILGCFLLGLISGVSTYLFIQSIWPKIKHKIHH